MATNAVMFPAWFASLFLPRKWAPKEAAFLSIGTALVVVLYQILGMLYPPLAPLWVRKVHPIYSGTAIALVVFVAVAIIRQFTGPWWSAKKETPTEL
jgi:Na+/proline symporter